MRPIVRLLSILTIAAVTVHGQTTTDSRRQLAGRIAADASGEPHAGDRPHQHLRSHVGRLAAPHRRAAPGLRRDAVDAGTARSPAAPRSGRTVPVTSPASWTRQKQALRTQMERSILGRCRRPPDNLRATVTATPREGGATVRDVRLEFGPGRRATLRVELVIPGGRGRSRLPHQSDPQPSLD